jgi:hypothetical protein
MSAALTERIDSDSWVLSEEFYNLMQSYRHEIDPSYTCEKFEAIRRRINDQLAAAVLAENDRCAKICDAQAERARTSPGSARATACAAAIRWQKP